MKLIIDPGHGGPKPGAVVDGVEEAKVVWDIASKLAAAVLANVGVLLPHTTDVRLTRSEGEIYDTPLSLRGRIAKQFSADLAISLHADASPSPSTRGVRCYYWPGNTKALNAAMHIASAFPKELRHVAPLQAVTDVDISRPGNEWKYRARNVLGVYSCSAILIECGFLTNPIDRGILQDADVQQGMVSAILCGILAYFRP